MRTASVVLWIAFAVLVAAVLWSVLAACGLAWPGGRPMLVFCSLAVGARQVDPALGAEQDRQLALQSAIRDLEIALLDRPYCAVAPQPGLEPGPPSIEDAIREGEQRALAGCWELSSDYTLYDLRTGEPRRVQDWELCFAEDGSGSQTLSVTGGNQCAGRVDATFPDQTRLMIRDAGDMRCHGGDWGFVRARAITCELGAGGTAQCLSRDVVAPDAGVASVTIRRKS
jgi:hypothetical protein